MGTFFSSDESRWLTAEILLRSSSRSGLLARKPWRRGLVLVLCSGVPKAGRDLLPPPALGAHNSLSPVGTSSPPLCSESTTRRAAPSDTKTTHSPWSGMSLQGSPALWPDCVGTQEARTLWPESPAPPA